jgi:hypothetical protein
LGIKLQLKDITPQEAEQKLVATKKEYRKVVPLAPAWRHEHLNSAARAKAKEKGTKFKSEKKQLIQIEKARQQNRCFLCANFLQVIQLMLVKTVTCLPCLWRQVPQSVS